MACWCLGPDRARSDTPAAPPSPPDASPLRYRRHLRHGAPLYRVEAGEDRMKTLTAVFLASVLASGVGCAKQGWIDRTLVTESVTGV